MEHLFSKGVLHPHLAACNVLIAERGHVKISAFGLADHHCLSQSTTVIIPFLTILITTLITQCPSRLRWLSPEHFKKDATVDRQSILWSLGVLIWEVVSLGSYHLVFWCRVTIPGGTPYSNIRTATGIVDGLRDGSLTLDNVNYCSQAMYGLKIIDEEEVLNSGWIWSIPAQITRKTADQMWHRRGGDFSAS